MKVFNFCTSFRPDHWIKTPGCNITKHKDGMISCSDGSCMHRFGARGFATLREAKAERAKRVKDQINYLKKQLKELK